MPEVQYAPSPNIISFQRAMDRYGLLFREFREKEGDMIPWWVGVLAFMVGGFFGILITSLLAAAGRADEEQARYRGDWGGWLEGLESAGRQPTDKDLE